MTFRAATIFSWGKKKTKKPKNQKKKKKNQKKKTQNEKAAGNDRKSLRRKLVIDTQCNCAAINQ